jgi:hypothetical protein
MVGEGDDVRRVMLLVIPGPSAARSPESVTTIISGKAAQRVSLRRVWLWIPHLPLCGNPE